VTPKPLRLAPRLGVAKPSLIHGMYQRKDFKDAIGWFYFQYIKKEAFYGYNKGLKKFHRGTSPDTKNQRPVALGCQKICSLPRDPGEPFDHQGICGTSGYGQT
tara:strand:- start:314 stop:622 length:309 start_codon:yes stop_codon:yes gene_type:complete